MKDQEMSVEEFKRRMINSKSGISLMEKKFQQVVKKEKKSKYFSTKTEVDGIIFHSKLEANYYQKLKILANIGEITKIERQVRYEYLIIYTPRHTPIPNFDQKACYIADFRITYKDGRVEVIDTKGFLTDDCKRKLKIVKKLFNIDVKIVK